MVTTYPHRIRLRGPWNYQVMPDGPTGRVVMPASWGSFRGTMTLRRPFGYPGQIDEDERVWLTLAGYSHRGQITLNGVLLASEQAGDQPLEFDVTGLLRTRNLLEIELTGQEEGGLWGEVALEVRCLAFLREVRVEVIGEQDEPGLRVTGQCVGPEGSFFDLYAVLNRRPVLYQSIPATLAGQRFLLVAEETPAASWESEAPGQPLVARIDLVKGAVVWYTISRELQLPPARNVEVKG